MRITLLTTTALIAAVTGLGASPAFAADVSSQDSSFMRAAHQGNLAEIAAGQDAQKNATTACVKAVGSALVRDHGKLDADVKALARKLGVSLPGAPAPEDRQKLAALKTKAGTPAYDAGWLAEQDAAHEKTLVLIDQEIAAGENAQVVAAAKSARPVVAMHLDMVRGGTCHAAKAPKTVSAGTGGHLAALANDRAALGAAALACGGLLAAGAGFLIARGHRRRSTES
ncbi:DUF4142 domain-containing protein [Streptomyces sp. NPDC003035]|uniref:DUF4142 domain-containing protein n=1 Tax=unclassified Streptomyces TaxID=2593676 RepID=UPI0033A4AD5F